VNDELTRLIDARYRPKKLKSFCSNGHPFLEANTLWESGVRRCRICRWKHNKEQWQKRKERNALKLQEKGE
jgi:hypothetical protein